MIFGSFFHIFAITKQTPKHYENFCTISLTANIYRIGIWSGELPPARLGGGWPHLATQLDSTIWVWVTDAWQTRVGDIIEIGKAAKPERKKLTRPEREKLIAELTAEMREAARTLEFEKAAYLRDKIKELKK